MTEIAIRAPRPEDVAPLTEMANLPGVRAGTPRLPYTGEDVMRRRILEQSPNAHHVVAELRRAPVALGTLLRGAGRRGHSGEVFLTVHDAHRGRGVGTRVLGALTGLADDWLGLLRLQLEVATDNHRAVRLHERAGFEVEGTLRGDAIREGRLEDSHVMGRLRPAPARRVGP